MKINDKIIKNNYAKNESGGIIKKILLIIIFIILLSIIFFTLGYSLNNKIILNSENISVPNINKYLNGYTILHISDLNGNMEIIKDDSLAKLLHAKRFNSICLTGNMIGNNNSISAFSTLVEQLKRINNKALIYYLPGEYDPSAINQLIDQEVKSSYILELEKLGVIYLDRPYYEEVGKNKIWFTPEYLYSIDPKATLDAMTTEIEELEKSNDLFLPEKASLYKSISYKSRIMEEAINAQKTISENDIQVIVSSLPLDKETISTHIRFSDPENMLSLRKAHLLLSGSLVGGQWCLPGRQPIYVPDYGFLPDKSEISGKSRVLTLDQYISPGLSCSPIYPYPNIRIYNPPTISLIKFNKNY